MKRKNFFICFTGIDGSGKTTLAKETINMFLRQGISCKYVYNRFIPFLSRPLTSIGRKLFMAKEDIFKDYEKHSQSKQQLLKNKAFSYFYQFLILGDYFFQILFKVKLPLMLGQNIVCDRYIYDTIITDLALSLGYSEKVIKNILEKHFYFIPKPDLVFLIDVSEEIAYSRKRDIPCKDYLNDRRQFYLEVGKSAGMVILDGTRNITELVSEIKVKLDELLVLELAQD